MASWIFKISLYMAGIMYTISNFTFELLATRGLCHVMEPDGLNDSRQCSPQIPGSERFREYAHLRIEQSQSQHPTKLDSNSIVYRCQVALPASLLKLMSKVERKLN